ncbi:MAG: YIP1 family protein [Roseobacter sp.]
MKNTTDFPKLALLTLRDPNAASKIILGWNLSREAIWTSIALVCVIVTILSTVTNMIFPVPPLVEKFVGNSLLVLAITAGGFIATAYCVFWVGRRLGGSGNFEDLLTLLLWLQVVRATAQLCILIALIIAPVLASFLALFVAVATLWVLVHFIRIGLNLESLMRAAFVLIASAIALLAASSFLLIVLGVSPGGVPLNV